jgi:hypothetical protein
VPPIALALFLGNAAWLASLGFTYVLALFIVSYINY